MRVDEVRQLAVCLVIFGSAGAIDVLHPMTSADQLIGHHLGSAAPGSSHENGTGNRGKRGQLQPMAPLCFMCACVGVIVCVCVHVCICYSLF